MTALRKTGLAMLLWGFALQAAGAPSVLRHNGKKFFPLAAYTSYMPGTVDNATQYFSTMKSRGLNSALTCYYDWNANYLTYVDNVLHGAAANDMPVMVEIKRCAVLLTCPASDIDTQVNTLKGHSALLGWYLIDQPEYKGPGNTPMDVGTLQAAYDRVKALDGGRYPIFVEFGDWGSSPHYADMYLGTYDAVMTNYYPVYAADPEFGGKLWRPTKGALYNAQLVAAQGLQVYFNVPQTFYGFNDHRLPTFGEHRYLSYAPITVGARGLFYWMYGSYTSEIFWANTAAPINEELQSLIPAILSDTTAVTVSSNRDTDTTGNGIVDVTYLFGMDPQWCYVMAVNNTAKTFTTQFTLSGDLLLKNVVWQGVYIDMDTVDRPRGLTRVDYTYAHTEPATIGGLDARKTIADNDYYFYFNVDDGFAYQGSQPDVYITINYYDNGTGILRLDYDSTSNATKVAGYKTRTNTNTWKSYTWHVTDAYFGNRQYNVADFRVRRYAGDLPLYLDVVDVSVPQQSVTIPVLFEQRNASLQPTAAAKTWTLSDSFSPYDVNVYRICTGIVPDQVTNLTPLDKATGVFPTADLTWSGGADTQSYDVYFGTSNPPEFRVNQPGTAYDPGLMAEGVTHFWRIDSVGEYAKTEGTIWSFTTMHSPEKAAQPIPPNETTGVNINRKLQWSAAAYTTSYDVYMGTAADGLVLKSSHQTATNYDPPGNMDIVTTYYWRIDTVNDYRTVTGDIWQFTTASYLGDFDLDFDVDQEDFGRFQACLSGTTTACTPECRNADLDADGDIDQADFTRFLNCMDGPNLVPGC